MNTGVESHRNGEQPLIHDENGELSLHFGFPTIQSRMSKRAPEKLVLDYTRTMMGFLLFQPQPERIAMIGLGGGSLAKYCHRHLPDSRFCAVELSPEVIALREMFAIPPDGDSLQVVCADGADFVRQNAACFDVLLVDGFDREGQPPQLCSADFYATCRAALRPSGVLVVNLCADDPARDTYVGRLDAAFDGRSVAVEADEGDNVIVFASQTTPFPPPLSTLSERLRVLEARHKVELERTAQKILGHGRTSRRKTGRRG